MRQTIDHSRPRSSTSIKNPLKRMILLYEQQMALQRTEGLWLIYVLRVTNYSVIYLFRYDFKLELN